MAALEDDVDDLICAISSRIGLNEGELFKEEYAVIERYFGHFLTEDEANMYLRYNRHLFGSATYGGDPSIVPTNSPATLMNQVFKYVEDSIL